MSQTEGQTHQSIVRNLTKSNFYIRDIPEEYLNKQKNNSGP